MGAIEDVRNLLQDIVSPDIKAIKARLDALEGTIHHLARVYRPQLIEADFPLSKILS
jgi:hypothetical protein